jgi:PAS domain-containing protein
MGLVDAAIFAAAAVVVITLFRHRQAIQALRLHAPVAWIIGGMSLLALFYAGDFVVMAVLPGLASPELAMAAMTDLHLNWSWLASLLAVVCIAVGLFGLVGRMLPSAGESSLHVEAELEARQRADATIRESEARYRELFEGSPISIWDEDWSAVKAMIDELRDTGVADFANIS